MKKILSLSIIFVLALSLFACAGSTTAQSASPSATKASASESATPSAAVSASASASATPAAQVNLTIAAAASLKTPLDDIIKAYSTVAPNVKITVTYGASGTLQTQIEQGAPADIFFSAAAKQMDALDKEGLLVTATKVNVLKNDIVLIVPTASTLKIADFKDVATDAVSKIALGDTKSVPAGQYAQDTFTSLKIWDTVSGKANFGTDVKQVLSWVESGNVDCGVVYKTDAASDSKVKIVATAPDGSHTPVVYPLAVVKASTNQEAAASFIKYMQTADSMSIFTKSGFIAYK